MRVIETKHANPRLASHAANVNNTNVINNSSLEELLKIINVIVKIIPSKANKDIKKWFRCKIIVRIHIIVIREINEEVIISIANRESQSLVYKTNASLKLY